MAVIDSFYEGTGDNYNYNSREVSIDREGVDSCDQGNVAFPEWDAGDEVECWRPSSPSKGISKVYRCGNDECIKAFDPQDDIDRAVTIAKTFWITGAALLGTSGILILIAFIVKAKSYSKLSGGPTHMF